MKLLGVVIVVELAAVVVSDSPSIREGLSQVIHRSKHIHIMQTWVGAQFQKQLYSLTTDAVHITTANPNTIKGCYNGFPNTMRLCVMTNSPHNGVGQSGPTQIVPCIDISTIVK